MFFRSRVAIAALLQREIKIQDKGLGFRSLRQKPFDRGRQQFPDPSRPCTNRGNFACKDLTAHCSFSSLFRAMLAMVRLPRATPAISSGRNRWMSE